ncbi:MAG: malate dehydrogenase [ANME-2 cluster archaeon]|nr:malate dehydrogenase [ANME-2 cluster archaeon]MDF1558403.1 malate dehydrogenase [ANME-2 cluster archaeon]
MKKITVVGAGFVGATAVQRIVEKELGDVVMIDVIEGMPQGKALDLMESAPIEGFDVEVMGTNDYKDIEGSDVVVITAGIARKPGMSRDDLVKINSTIVSEVCENIKKYAPESIVIVVTNPLDIMTHVALKMTEFHPSRVIGMSGVLDSARFATFVAKELGCSARDVDAMVLGGHGDSMVPLPRLTTVSGVPITELMDDETIDRLVQRTINGGAEIVELLKTGSAFYAPSAAITTMVASIVRDQKRILPAAVYLHGQYGHEGIYLGVPVKLGRMGVEAIVELDLTESEQAMLERSADAVKKGISTLEI